MTQQLHFFFFPFMAHGHTIPFIDLAILFATKGVKSTIIATPSNAPHIKKVTHKANKLGYQIDTLVIKFPAVEAGLPDGCDDTDKVPSPDMMPKFFLAVEMLKQPLSDLLKQHCPHCLVADMFFPWTTEVAAMFKVPRLVFHGTCVFSLSAVEHVRLYQPHKSKETFTIPNFPGDDIKMTTAELEDYIKQETWQTKLFNDSKETESKCFGVIVNSFYELESVYADHYTDFLGRRAWHVGPITLSTKEQEKESNDERGKENWLLEFEKRMEGKGLVIRGWAPQVLILENEAIGGFVTHCGWNSILESVTAGVPVITWPVAAEQFYNEKLLVEVLKIGVGVGARKWKRLTGDFVKSEAIEKAVKEIMVGEKAMEMRNRVKRFADMAKKAVEDGGSSESHLNALIGELSSIAMKTCK
ncbi:scopoletin glucosyltransferase-like [Gossypium australe]|uniref:Glycosyltransferase n=1 Tax=Gossypium australe TaxID=47621 RepID=A0A5B6V3A8_9ROSI|nr:scopoletin glucosyltransferase-like [Gossypium australe]